MTDDTPEVLKWGRRTTIYRCRLCAFDTPDKAIFEDHFRKVHAPLQVIEARRQAVADLRARADKDGVTLEPSAKKADIIAAIEAAPKE